MVAEIPTLQLYITTIPISQPVCLTRTLIQFALLWLILFNIREAMFEIEYFNCNWTDPLYVLEWGEEFSMDEVFVFMFVFIFVFIFWNADFVFCQPASLFTVKMCILYFLKVLLAIEVCYIGWGDLIVKCKSQQNFFFIKNCKNC